MRFLIVLLLFLRISFLSFGWGETGHHIIAEIAKEKLNQNIIDSVNKYLGDITWESASTWMDDMRRDPGYQFMKKWHYVNIEEGKQYDSIEAGKDNVVYQLQNAINNLKNRSKLTKDEINFNLKVLFHLIGDFHQPLHVGYAEDRGGNEIKLTFNGKKTNLHRLWDDELIENQKINFITIKQLLNRKINKSYAKMQKINVIEWLNQSRKLLTAVYNYSNPIEEKYITDSENIIEHQLMLAGLRLSLILNTVFSV